MGVLRERFITGSHQLTGLLPELDPEHDIEAVNEIWSAPTWENETTVLYHNATGIANPKDRHEVERIASEVNTGKEVDRAQIQWARQVVFASLADKGLKLVGVERGSNE